MKKSVDKAEGLLNQKGYTLVEMMVTIAIAGILLTLAINAYNGLQQRNRVWAAAEELGGLMQGARMRALATGSTQYVTVDIAGDTIASTFWGGTYDSGTGHVTGAERSTDGVDWIDSKADGTAPASPITTKKTFSFTSRGTGSSESIKVKWKDATVTDEIVITVNGTTGRVNFTEL